MKRLHVLVVGSAEWYKEFSGRYEQLSDTYEFEFISDVSSAKGRLEHNSYDVLIIDSDFIKEHSIQLSKMAYAMSRPVIIVCNSLIKYICQLLWKRYSYWTNRFTISKSMIFFKLKRDLSILDDTSFFFESHNNLKNISAQITSIVF